MRKLYLVLLIGFISLKNNGQSIIELNSNNGFKLVSNQETALLYYSLEDDLVVQKAVELFRKDIGAVTGEFPKISTDQEKLEGQVVVIGTIDKNPLIQKLVKKNLIDDTKIRSKWETYLIQVIDTPFPKVEKALVIVGSDRRGAAYGVFELSKQMGVSPWYWWADVPVKKRKDIIINNGTSVFGPPSVQYRGIFINDEDWGLHPWASQNFDKESGDIGPKTYAKIFELMLRLKANYVWPAMHECSKPFNYFKNNKLVADSFAIIMGSSHHEPLLFNTSTEWPYSKKEWNPINNMDTVMSYLEQRVVSNGLYENIYTVGMRSTNDRALLKNISIDEQTRILENVIFKQRDLLKKHIHEDITKIPQVFIPYKEVLNLYNNNMNLPDDITLVWVDDNYGYIRRLANKEERKRDGGSGVYYHASYLGSPGSYLWLNTTSPVLIWEEMFKAYEFNAKKVWVLNVGDIKPGEYCMNFFLDLAWDVHSVEPTKIFDHLNQWAGEIFGSYQKDQIEEIMQEYYQLAFSRKPEFMSWGRMEWGEYFGEQRERVNDMELSYYNYREIENRVSAYEKMYKKSEKIYNNLKESIKPAYFQLIHYPVQGSYLINKKCITAYKNRIYAREGRTKANLLAAQSKMYHDSILLITNYYNQMFNGKWNKLMNWKHAYWPEYNTVLSKIYWPIPTEKVELLEGVHPAISVEGKNIYEEGFHKLQNLPTYNKLIDESYFIEIYNKGNKAFEWKADVSHDWIKLSTNGGTIQDEERVYVSMNWDKIIEEKNIGKITITSGGFKQEVYVYAISPNAQEMETLKGLFVEHNGVISMHAENYHRKIESDEVSWLTLKGIGNTGAGVISQPFIAENYHIKSLERKNKPHLEYDFYVFHPGNVDITSMVLPTHPINADRGARFAISIDDEFPYVVDFSTKTKTAEWKYNVFRNSSFNHTSHYIPTKGKHTLKIWYIDSGVVFDKFILDFGGLKKSYLGPRETRVE